MIGKSIGRYHIIDQLGRGGMATVYKAYDTRLEREVAIKLIRRDAVSSEMVEQMLKRFEREAKVLAKLDHPNIVKLLDYGEYEGSPYLVMQYVRGGVIKIIPASPVPYPEAASILIPIARALGYAHRHAMIHRDVKPSNILLSDENLPMLSDFGIAKILGSEGETSLTGTGMGIGTPEYMSPEQGLGQVVDHRADIYSLGVVFYQMVTGHKPYEATTPMAVVIKHINDALPNPRLYVRDLPERVVRIIYKAMAKNPADRYQSMAEFATALESLKSDVGNPAKEQQGMKAKAIPPMAIPQQGKPAAPSITTLPTQMRPAMTNPQKIPVPPAPALVEKKRPRRGLWILGCGGIALLFGLVGAGAILVSLIGKNGGLGVGLKKAETPPPTETAMILSSNPVPSETMLLTTAPPPPTLTPTPPLSVQLGDSVYVEEGGFLFQPIESCSFTSSSGYIMMMKKDGNNAVDPFYQFYGFPLDGSLDLQQLYEQMKGVLGSDWLASEPRPITVDGKPGLASDITSTLATIQEHKGIFVVVWVSAYQGFYYVGTALTEDWNKEISEVSDIVLKGVHFFDIPPLPTATAFMTEETPTLELTPTPTLVSSSAPVEPTPTQVPDRHTKTPTSAPTAVPTKTSPPPTLIHKSPTPTSWKRSLTPTLGKPTATSLKRTSTPTRSLYLRSPTPTPIK
jgi:serine/threonine protein kinase